MERRSRGPRRSKAGQVVSRLSGLESGFAVPCHWRLDRVSHSSHSAGMRMGNMNVQHRSRGWVTSVGCVAALEAASCTTFATQVTALVLLLSCSRPADPAAPDPNGSAGAGGVTSGTSTAGATAGAAAGGGGGSPPDFSSPVVIFEQLPKAPSGNVAAVDVDEAAGYVNFANRWSNQVERVPIGGGPMEVLGPHGDVGGDDRITSDAEHVYWLDAERQEDLSLRYSVAKYSKGDRLLTSLPLDREFPYGNVLSRQEKLYVAAVMCSPLGRMNKDGTSVELSDNTEALEAGGSSDVAVDESAFYCSNLQQIFRWSHEASDPEVIYQPEGRLIYGLAVHDDELYFMDSVSSGTRYATIQRMPTAGGEAEQLAVSTQGYTGPPTGALLLDSAATVLYWIGPRLLLSTTLWANRLGSEHMATFLSGRAAPLSLQENERYLFWAEENTVIQMRKPSIP